ncbi:hypothetical protein QJS10_CPB22g00685 [Acorus calamus]|uniref:GPI transamidase component PIG-S n=1 Tax=Acorus calamus TaxID=4465 RepID=A0AAV9C1Q0_ACOCL|nr:hypothetical protein QJS10_CPB22g00685 [Acorus calamus]
MADAHQESPIKEEPPPPPYPSRATKPGLKRLLLTLTILLSFIAGFPFLLKSTEIYRSPLPHWSIESLSRSLKSNPPFLPCRFHAVFFSSGHRPDELAASIAAAMKKRRSAAVEAAVCGKCGAEFNVTVTTMAATDDDGEIGSLDGDDEAVDEMLESLLKRRGGEGGGGGRVYTVFVMEREGMRKVVVGKHRHAWIVGRVTESEAVEMIGGIFVEYFINGGKEGGEVIGENGEFMPVGADGRVVLSFSLLNADPSDWVYDWDFQKTGEIMMAPVVEALAPVANITLESQVLYHTPKSSLSYWDEKLRSYVFSIRDLPFFANSNEWHLDTSIAAAGRTRVLQFVVYVPSAKECPLLLQLPNGEISMTNGYISPTWGGVVVWNPPECLGPTQDPLAGRRNTGTPRKTIPSMELQKVFQVFVGQLRQLFGLKSSNVQTTGLGISNFVASENGFTEWELDVLFRHHACSNLDSCVTTLGSLSRLVQSLPRMIVMDEIGKQVKLSLEAASLAQNNASQGIYDASAVSSRKARALAEDAFFHPSIMSISYSSFEHYFAIYMPFFAPVSLHVLLAAAKELKRYKQERAKYLASRTCMQ